MTESQTPVQRFVAHGSRAAMAAVVVMMGARTALMDTGLGNVVEFLLGVVAGALAVTLFVWLARALATLLAPVGARPLATLLGLGAAIAFLATTPPAEIARTVLDVDGLEWPFGVPDGLAVPSVAVVVLAIAAVYGWFSVLRGDRERRVKVAHLGGLSVLTLGLVAAALTIVVRLSSDGNDPFPSDYRTLAEPAETLPAADPSRAGPFEIERLSYGAGDSPRRPEFGARRLLESRTVDATALLPEWKGLKRRMRERYWGFGLDEAPLNGLLWAPREGGPYPLVLIVHGNHGMEEYSDPGYAYLGELLASHGMIAVSVDENYINGSWSGDFRGKEMPLRAWLLLEHLALWRDWNDTDGHRFADRVDMDNIALVGHSRGGEALPIAYTMNGLTHYPDDATVRFDYGFAIRSLVAIAQVDQRYHRRLAIEDVNFLALQGSYDSDEPAFHGLRQFNRTQLNADDYHFKAGVYVHGANHGQFNSIWGREDFSPPGSWLLNLAPLISADDQQQVAKVFVTAFLKTTLTDGADYSPLFRDPRAGSAWLPDLAYVQQFSDSTFTTIADFEEDLDVLTATAADATIRATGFAGWREEELKHRDERPQGSSAVVLSWHASEPATYEIELPAAFWQGVAVDDTWLSLSVSGSTEQPKSASDDDEDRDDGEKDDEREPQAPKFVLEGEDFSGRRRSVASPDVAHLAPPLRVRYLKHEASNAEQYNDVWEPVLQYVELPLAELVEDDAEVAGLRYLRFRFDAAESGTAILDNVALRREPLARRMPALLQEDNSQRE